MNFQTKCIVFVILIPGIALSLFTTIAYGKETKTDINEEIKDDSHLLQKDTIAEKSTQLPIIIPLFDYPFNTISKESYPSMYQSLELTKGAGYILHQTMGTTLEKQIGSFWSMLSVGLFDLFIYSYLPLGDAWLHEEWHRAVLAHRNIQSYNEVYEFDFFATVIKVSHVKDEDLIRLKRRYPSDMVRLSEAGIEAQYELTKSGRMDFFFSNHRMDYEIFNWWLNIANSIAYIHLCTTDEADKETDVINRNEETIEERDFVGLDFTAWVYDLFRPDEPYENRGVHPSGKGIDRYIKHSDLSDEEKQFLKTQFYLSLLNLVSPQLIGINRLKGRNPLSGQKFYWNTMILHYLTSFGYAIDVNVMYKESKYNFLFTYHNYANFHRYFPGMDVSLIRYPTYVAYKKILITAIGGCFVQPKNQLVKSRKYTPGVWGSLKLNVPLFSFSELFIKMDGKTKGWIAGFVDLEEAYRISTGFNLFIF